MAIVLAQSSEELSKFIQKDISAISGILRTETFVSLEILKGTPALLDKSALIHNLESNIVEQPHLPP